MSFNINTYEAPGVYISQTQASLLTVAGLPGAVVGIVGPAQGYFTTTESYVVPSTGTITLNQQGPNENTVVVKSATGTIYTLNTDYSLVLNNGATAAQNTITLTPILTSMTAGSTIYVTYQYTDANYAMPRVYTNFTAVQNDWGAPFDPTSGNITSPITLAAQIAFYNGATTLVVVPTTDTNGTATVAGLTAAYDNLAAVGLVDLLVPLAVGVVDADNQSLGTALASFLQAQEAVGDYIMGIVGFETTTTTEPDVLASAIDYKRVVEAWPSQMLWYNNVTGATITLGGYYLAAAYAGTLASGKFQDPLTRKHIGGFSGIPASVLNTMTLSYKNQLSAAGVAVLEPAVGGGFWVRHGVTTAGSSLNVDVSEISVVRGADAMMDVMQATINQSGFIGTAFTITTVATINSLITATLEQLVADGVIISYDSLAVTQSTSTPLVINVSFNYTPAYPVNYININFGVDNNGITSATVG